MLFCKTYQVYNREQKAAQREQSFRSCLVILIVFIFLGLILILANIPWKQQDEKKYNEQHTERTSQMSEEDITEATTIPISTTTISTSRPTPNTTTASTTESETLSTSQTISKTVTAESTITPSTSQAEYSKYEEHTEETTVTTLSTNETTLSSLQKKTASTAERGSMNEINESSSKTPNTESHSVEKINSSSTVHEEDAKTITTTITEQSSKKDVESTTWINIIDINNVGNIDDDRNSTDINKESQNNILNDTSSTTSSLPNDAGNSTETIYDIHSQFEKYTTNATFGATEATTTLISSNHSTIMTVPTSYDTNFPSTTIFPKNTNDICNTSYCRQIASKMLSYMNVSANPCNDFYKYACGGFETNPLMIDVDQARRFSNYERIKEQMMKVKRENVSSTFVTYYNSCVKYERTVSFSERIKMARDALDEVGKFYVKDTCSADSANFTDLFAKLILHHSAFLFDVVPEVDGYHPNSFTLKIGPTSYESPFKAEYVEDLCSENDFKTDIHHVDFKAMYDRYKTCKKQDEKDEIRKSVSDALIILKVFGDLNDNDLELKRINETINVINSVIMQEYFSHFSNKSYSQEVYPENDYKRISLKELEDNNAFINWTHLIESLTKTNEIIDKDIQVYFLNSMVEGLQELKEFAERNCTDLHNAIMALYAHKLYQELVLPRQNTKNHCLHVATYLLRPEATNLYISSFADHEIKRMNNRTTDMFNELKQTLKWKIENVTWVKEKEKKALLDKINSLELALPPVSYFKNEDLLYNDYNISQNTLSENYFDNSISLMKRYRTLMYTEIKREFNISVQLWTYYVTPFQSEIKMIYGLNQIVIPYGIIDWTINNEDSLNYISLATLGNIIALQIAHHFDEIGIYYWNQTRNTESLIFQNVSLPQLAVNKQLSRKTGFKLTYDTLDRTRSKVQEKNLPWMNFHIDKLFYLAYAQMYCTKTPLTSSYVALYESEDLPNRILVYVTMFKNPLIDVAWNCPMDQCDPKDTCSELPDIHVKESAKPE